MFSKTTNPHIFWRKHLIREITARKPEEEAAPPHDLKVETETAINVATTISSALLMGKPSVYTCPDCGGVLFEHKADAILKYKCHTGYSFSERDLIMEQARETEESLWFAIRSLEQRRTLLESLEQRYRKTGNRFLADDYQKRAEEIKSHIENIKKIVISNMDQPDDV